MQDLSQSHNIKSFNSITNIILARDSPEKAAMPRKRKFVPQQKLQYNVKECGNQGTRREILFTVLLKSNSNENIYTAQNI